MGIGDIGGAFLTLAVGFAIIAGFGVVGILLRKIGAKIEEFLRDFFSPWV